MTAAIDAVDALPRWDLDSIFPGPESPELRAALVSVESETARLEALFDLRGVGTRPPDAGDAGLVAAVEEILNEYNQLLDDAARPRSRSFAPPLSSA